MDDGRLKIQRALDLLEKEIDKRCDVITALKEAAGALRESLGSFSYAEMTTKEVMVYLGISHTTLNRYIGGKVPFHKGPFPHPINVRGRLKIYNRDDIVIWKNEFIIT